MSLFCPSDRVVFEWLDECFFRNQGVKLLMSERAHERQTVSCPYTHIYIRNDSVRASKTTLPHTTPVRREREREKLHV